jgi:hypothetical protein
MQSFLRVRPMLILASMLCFNGLIHMENWP